MLHAHAHEPIKHFGKALFSTFLGLLMALGLESWYHEHHRQRLAEVALESVIREAEDNRKALATMAADYREAPKRVGELIGILESLQDARASHRPWRPKELAGQVEISHTAGSLKSSAWVMALSNQSVQRFPETQAEVLAAFYQQLGRFQAFLDQPVDYTCLPAIGATNSSVSFKRRLERFSDAELERILWSFRTIKARMDMTRQWSEALGQGMDERNGFRKPHA